MMDSSSSNTLISSLPSSGGTPQETFIRLCLIMTAVHMSPTLPPGCKRVLTPKKLQEMQESGQLDRILGSLGRYETSEYVPGMNAKDRHNNGRVNNHVKYHFQYTSRSLSVIGVLGGIVLILLLVALSSCIRNRRNALLERESNEHGRFARQILIDHIRQVNQSRRRVDEENEVANDTPPAYDEVVKKLEDDTQIADEEQQQPPSYIEAMEKIQDHVIPMQAISLPTLPSADSTQYLTRNESGLTEISVISNQDNNTTTTTTQDDKQQVDRDQVFTTTIQI